MAAEEAPTLMDGLELSELCVMQRQALGTEIVTKQSFQGWLGDRTAKAQLEDGRAERIPAPEAEARGGSSVLAQTEPHRKF